MQVWLESGDHIEGVDLILGKDLIVDGDAIYIEGKQVGRKIRIANSDDQSRARSLIGSIEWLLLELDNWKMIPIENIIAACEGGPTKVAARIDSAEQILGAAFALQIGVDAILVPQDIVETALIAKSQRGELSYESTPLEKSDFSLSTLKIIEVRDGGFGDRVCVDLTCLLNHGEGMLIGSSSASMTLVHGETIDSEFVPTRPFRVNAGAAHSYILMADDTTKYLSELKMGDIVKIISEDNSCRNGTVGRVKIERRPFKLIRWIDENHNEAGVLLQQAETVRLVTPEQKFVPVTELVADEFVLGWVGGSGRHIGVEIGAEVSER